MLNNEFGSLERITIDKNHLAGGGYTVYCDNRKSATNKVADINIANNKMGKGQYGYFALYSSGARTSGNVDAVTGAAVS